MLVKLLRVRYVSHQSEEEKMTSILNFLIANAGSNGVRR